MRLLVVTAYKTYAIFSNDKNIVNQTDMETQENGTVYLDIF